MKNKTANKRKSHPLDDLPFVAMNGKTSPRNFWNVTSTGDYTKDCELGREYAQQYLVYQATADENCATLLAWIVMDMMANFRPVPTEERAKSSIINAEGIIVGFMHEIGAHAEWSKNIDQMLLHHPSVLVSGPDKTAWPSDQPVKVRIVEEEAAS